MFVQELNTKYIPLLSDPAKRDEAISILYKNNYGLAYSAVAKFNNVPVDPKEIEASASQGLLKAIKSFRNDKEATFPTYAITCISNEILMLLRKEKRYSERFVSLENIVSENSEGQKLKQIDILDNKCDMIEDYLKAEEASEFKAIINSLDSIEKYVIVHCFGLFDSDVVTKKQVMEDLRITRRKCEKSYESAIEKIKLGLLQIKKNEDEENSESCEGR